VRSLACSTSLNKTALKLGTVIFLLIILSQVSSASITFTSDVVAEEELSSQSFKIDGYRRIFAYLPVDKHDFVEINLKTKVSGDISGNGFLVYDSHYTQQQELKENMKFIHEPSESEKTRIEIQAYGKGELKIYEAKITVQEPEFRYDGELYIAYLYIKAFSADEGFKAEIKTYSRESFDAFNYTVKVNYFGREIFRESKSIVSKPKFEKGKIGVVEIEVPLRYFISPGFYTVEITSDDWSYKKNLTVLPGISTVLTAFISILTISAAFKYRREIVRWIFSLSTGQKFVLAAIILLVISAVYLALEKENTANSSAILAYYFLILGVGNLIFEFIFENRRDEKNDDGGEDDTESNSEKFDPHPEVRGALSLFILSLFTHYSPEVLKTMPYTDIITFTAGLLLVALLVYKQKHRVAG
jgi:hypothetical protein